MALLFSIFLLLPLFGCANVPGDRPGTEKPGEGEMTSDVADSESAAPVQTGVRSAEDIDVSETVLYERNSCRPELSDLALEALAERFAGSSSVRVTGVRVVFRSELYQEYPKLYKDVPDYYSYDVEVDNVKYTLDITFDNEISIYPYEYADLFAESEEGLLPVIFSEELQGNISGKYKRIVLPVELDLGGHKWTVEDDGTVLRDGTTVFKGTLGGIQNLCLTDFNRDGVQDIVIVVLLNPSMDHDYAFVAIDTKGGRVIWDNDNYSIYGLNKRIRYEYGLLLISKMRLAVNRNGELVLLDHPVGKTETYEYKICYDSVTDKIKLALLPKSLKLDFWG